MSKCFLANQENFFPYEQALSLAIQVFSFLLQTVKTAISEEMNSCNDLKNPTFG